MCEALGSIPSTAKITEATNKARNKQTIPLVRNWGACEMAFLELSPASAQTSESARAHPPLSPSFQITTQLLRKSTFATFP
jgi:hypothetical protein